MRDSWALVHILISVGSLYSFFSPYRSLLFPFVFYIEDVEREGVGRITNSCLRTPRCNYTAPARRRGRTRGAGPLDRLVGGVDPNPEAYIVNGTLSLRRLLYLSSFTNIKQYYST